jgi:prolyl-tRNA synthetase
VLYDDRDARPGSQFADADLLGVPLRFVVSERNLANGNVEWKRRGTPAGGTIELTQAVEFARTLVQRDLDALADSAAEF